MSSSNYLSLISAGATDDHSYAAQSIIADSALCPPPSLNVTGVAMSSQAASHPFSFAEFAAADEEPKSSTYHISVPAMTQIMKLEGRGSFRRQEHSQRSDISSDIQVMAEVCSSTTAATEIRFQPLSWALQSNPHDSLPNSQVRSAHFASNTMRQLLAIAAENEGTERPNIKGDMKTEDLAKMDTEACYGYPQTKVAVSMQADLNFNRGYDGNISSSIMAGRDVNASYAASGNGAASQSVMSGWFEPLASSHSLPEQLQIRPTFRDNLQPTTSISHQHSNAEDSLRGGWLTSCKELQQPCRSPLINAGVYAAPQSDDQRNYSLQNKVEAEASYNFHAHRMFASAEADDRLRISGISAVESQAPHEIPANNMSMQSIQSQIAPGSGSTLGWHSRNLTSIANAATKELFLVDRTQAGAGSGAFENNNSLLPQLYSTTANATVVDMDTQQLLLRSSLLDNNHFPIAAASRCYGQQQADQVVPAGGGHQFDTAANTNPIFSSALWGESYCKVDNQNLIPSSTSFMIQQAQLETPTSGFTLKNAISALTGNNAGHPAATFCPQSSAPLLPIANVAGSLARYIQPEDLSLRRPQSTDFFSLDCAFSRSGPVSVLRTSKYLKPAQQLLEECCNVKQKAHLAAALDRSAEAKELARKEAIGSLTANKQLQLNAEERCHMQMRKARLIAMVEELDRRYQQYQDHMQLVITSFESATGMGAAVPYTALARKLISKQFRALRDAIGEHIEVACKILGEDISNVPVLNKGETPRLRIVDQQLRHHRTLQQVGMLQQHQSWRPQRGLPERSVAVLRAWLFEHFLHPYPKDSEKLMLSRLTGLTRSQVANWFINARVRLWKPMVEQMYAEERKEDQSQGTAEACMAKHGQQENIDYGCSDGQRSDIVMMQAQHNNDASSNHYCQNSDHMSYDSGNSSMSHNETTTRHGVSLTLGLQHSSSVDLSSNSYNPNYNFNLQPASGDVNYTFV